MTFRKSRNKLGKLQVHNVIHNWYIKMLSWNTVWYNLVYAYTQRDRGPFWASLLHPLEHIITWLIQLLPHYIALW